MSALSLYLTGGEEGGPFLNVIMTNSVDTIWKETNKHISEPKQNFLFLLSRQTKPTSLSLFSLRCTFPQKNNRKLQWRACENIHLFFFSFIRQTFSRVFCLGTWVRGENDRQAEGEGVAGDGKIWGRRRWETITPYLHKIGTWVISLLIVTK